MAAVVVLLQGACGGAVMLAGSVADLLDVAHGLFEITPVWLALINLATFGFVIWWGVAANGAPARVLLATVPVPVGTIVGVVIATIGLALVLVAVVTWIEKLLPMPEFVRRMFFDGPALKEHTKSIAFVLVVVAPLTEETLFRGIVLRGLLARHRPAVAVVVSALLFGAVHLNPWQLVPATALGLVYGWWYVRTRSLVPCIFGHALHNGLVFVLAAWGAAGADTPSGDDLAASAMPWPVPTLGLAIAALGLWLTARTTRAMMAERAATPPPLPPAPPPLPLPQMVPSTPPVPPTAAPEETRADAD
jgi:membrane protease YdiL (CAAX protease family)